MEEFSFYAGIRDGKNPDLGSAVNIPDHFSMSLVKIIWDKNVLILCCGSRPGIWDPVPDFDSGSGMKNSYRD
jgi:hypothetical protein